MHQRGYTYDDRWLRYFEETQLQREAAHKIMKIYYNFGHLLRLQSHRFWEEGTLHKEIDENCVHLLSGEMRSKCIRIYIVRNVLNVAINLFRAAFFVSKERLARKFKKIPYVSFSGKMKSECIRIYIVRKVNGVGQPLKSHGIWEEHVTWKLKKIAYVLLSEEWRVYALEYILSGMSSTWLQPIKIRNA